MPYTSVQFRGTRVVSNPSNVFTFADLNVGTPSPPRTLLVSLSVYAPFTWSTYTDPTITVNGVTVVADSWMRFGDYGIGSMIFSIRIPTGTTVTATINVGVPATVCGIAYYTFKPQSTLPYSWNSDSGLDTQSYTGNMYAYPGFVAFVNAIAPATILAPTLAGGAALTQTTPEFLASGAYMHSAYAPNISSTGYVNFYTSPSSLVAPRAIAGSVYISQFYYEDTVIESPRITDTNTVGQKLRPTIARTFTFGDIPNYRLPVGYTESSADALAITETSAAARLIVLADTVYYRERYGFLYERTVTDLLQCIEEVTRGFPTDINDSFAGTDTAEYKIRPVPEISERVRVVDTPLGKFTLVPVMVERGRVRDAVFVAYPVMLSQTISVSRAVTAAHAKLVMERLGLVETLTGRSSLRPAFTDTIRLTDALRRFFGGDAVDSLLITESLVNRKRTLPTVSDSVRVSESTTRQFILRAIASDQVRLTDAQLLKLIFSRTLTEDIEVAAAFISPSSITTWAVNTRTGAVTEYSNYAFNSFAQLGNQYIGATDEGLYELKGDDDAGEDIIAQIKSGFAQFGGSRFTSFKAAYLGMRGTGDFVLKLETGDGKTYNYAVVAKDMQTTKVHMGKGLRARYFAFELVSTGQDFDLDNIEFVPLVAQRRV